VEEPRFRMAELGLEINMSQYQEWQFESEPDFRERKELISPQLY
jgi:hypothetical protein